MDTGVVLPALTSLLALVFSLALFDQWRERRGGYQLIWGIGMLFYGVAAGTEALAGGGGWSEALYRTWYLTGAVWTAGWLGLGTAYLLGRTRFGYSFALCLFLAGLFTFLVRNRPEYEGAGTLPLLYFIAAGLLALAVAVETYFQNDRWPRLAAAAVVGATGLSIILMAVSVLPAPGYAVDTATGAPVATLFPPELRLLTPFMNITGAFALILGAVFSTYVFMPKRRVLAYSLDPDQPGDEFLFNLLIAPIAIAVNLVASLPGAARALATGRIHSRVPSTILIAIGAFIPTMTDSLNRFGSTEWFQFGKFLGVLFLFGGFLVSIEVFREVRIPFTGIRLSRTRHESPEAARLARESEPTSPDDAPDHPSDRPTEGLGAV
ncbi:MAG: hypothetical protein OEV61_07325 [Chloroflexota bacterium]|jgi:hypothetical protein|nr:hypothetical protein [Chloroflexota bacterium]MDH5243107.1 hypothetical protein [Chloroflexota bacterium]